MSTVKLTKKDILSQRITALWASYGTIGDGDWLETVDGWLQLGNGHSVSIPFSGDGIFISEPLPKNVKRIRVPRGRRIFSTMFFKEKNGFNTLKSLFSLKIINVYSEFYEGKVDNEAPAIIVLSNNIALTYSQVAPYGTGRAGFNFYDFGMLRRAKEAENIRFLPFFKD